MKIKAIHSPHLPRVFRHFSLVLICMYICCRHVEYNSAYGLALQNNTKEY